MTTVLNLKYIVRIATSLCCALLVCYSKLDIGFNAVLMMELR